jgi:nicotinamidase-related amidase
MQRRSELAASLEASRPYLRVMNRALLVIDPLNDFISEGGKLWPYTKDVLARLDVVGNLVRLTDWARAENVPVVYVPHRRYVPGAIDPWRYANASHRGWKEREIFLAGSWGAEWHPALAPREGDLVATEHWLHDGFSNTDLGFQLQVRGLDHLLIAGMRANTCVEATSRRAVEQGFHVTMVSDASGSFRYEEWEATMKLNAPTFAHAIVTTADVVGAR